MEKAILTISNYMKIRTLRWALFGFGFMLTCSLVQAQTLTLEECYRLARENYPLLKKQGLISQSEKLAVSNAARLNLPQVSFSGQASYQSETLSFPEALGVSPFGILPEISKAQYRLQGDVSQNLFDGGLSKYQQETSHANAAVQRQSLEVSLYSLNDRVNQLYFSVLLIGEQLKQNQLRKNDLQNAAAKAEAALKNGTAFRSNVNELKAELANADMATTELQANRKTFLQMLSVLTGQSIYDPEQLQIPPGGTVSPSVKRPELALYDFQKKAFDVQEKQLRTNYLPKVNAFVQGAFGRPTLNIIADEAGTWYMAGLRFNWNLGSLYTLKNNRNLLEINRQNVDADTETFLRNTEIEITRYRGDIEKYRDLLVQDETVIELRTAVKTSAQSQLDNGVITTRDFIDKVNHESLARQNKVLHQIQLLQAQYNLKQVSGN